MDVECQFSSVGLALSFSNVEVAGLLVINTPWNRIINLVFMQGNVEKILGSV